MARDRLFTFEADQQNLSGDAVIELFIVSLKSGVQPIPTLTDDEGPAYVNAQAFCLDKSFGPDWAAGDVVNDASTPASMCSDSPNYDSSAFDPGTAEFNDADIEPRYEIDNLDIYGDFFLFCNWQTTDGSSVLFGGQRYLPLPYKTSGFAISNEGVLPNPTLTMSNVGLQPTALINSYNDLLGCQVVRRQVLAKHLDNGSEPNINLRWPDETWFIQRKASEDKLFVTFELSTPFDLDGVTLPRRRALRYACPWVYRGAECGYDGPPVADVKDNPTTSTEQDKCGKRVKSCKLRYTGSESLPYGGFPGLTLD